MDENLKNAVAAFLGVGNTDHGSLSVSTLAGDGSQRRFWRIGPAARGDTFVVMANPPFDDAARKENAAYLMIGNHLRAGGTPVPEIYWHDPDNGWFIMEDLGDRSLQDAALKADDPIPLYTQVLDVLFHLQVEGAKGFDPAWCCQTQHYDARVMRRFESDYFTDAFLIKYLGLKNAWPELEGAFAHLSATASRAEAAFLLHRDFQSRNIMVSGDRPAVIDWQAARIGPLGYDLASLLIDPYVGLKPHHADRIYGLYLERLEKFDPARVEPFHRHYPYLAIQRNLQMLGAFAHLTKAMGKSYFKRYIPPAVKSLHALLHRMNDPSLNALQDLAKRLTEHVKALDTSG
ncbi:MAG: phosphotransferase [Deltaproteobacteria bacterium]|nr:phosphotransferase [Deltaproteobacteria bacterium]